MLIEIHDIFYVFLKTLFRVRLILTFDSFYQHTPKFSFNGFETSCQLVAEKFTLIKDFQMYKGNTNQLSLKSLPGWQLFVLPQPGSLSLPPNLFSLMLVAHWVTSDCVKS